jgi:hypothetical protein
LSISPRIEWHPSTDARRRHQQCADGCAVLARWDAAPFETDPTDCFVRDDAYEIWQPGVGGLRFSPADRVAHAEPDHGVDPAWFERVVTRSWLPAVYQVWGRQVLHASAAVHDATGRVLVFTGPSGAGKSTLAYSLAQRRGWSQIADDTLAFSIEASAVVLHPLPNEARLRPATAAYHQRTGTAVEPLAWPQGRLVPHRLYLITPDARASDAMRLEPVGAAGAYTRLLEQAHAFTLAIAEFNRQLMRDYLALAAAVPAFRLIYRPEFDRLPDLLDHLERHAAAPAFA